MTKQMSKMLKYVSIFFVIVFSIYGAKKLMMWWFMSRFEPPPVTVSATQVTKNTWQSYLSAVGTLSAINGVDLATDTPGIVETIHFNSGQLVKKGEMLLQLRMKTEEANLKSNQAKLALAKMNYEREKTLFSKKVSSKASLDARLAELQQAEAGVETVEAQIAQKTLTAPFDGRLGIRQVNMGQYVSPGESIVTLQSLDPLYVMFNLPDQYLVDLYLGQPVHAVINMGGGKTVQGKITAINSKVDQGTRNVLVQATIPNENYALYPGMYASVKVWLQAKKESIIIPQTAISYSLSGDYVFVVKKEKAGKKDMVLRVQRQFVKAGERRDDQAAILSGLNSGDQIVIAGQLKLQNGSKVLIDNSVEL